MGIRSVYVAGSAVPVPRPALQGRAGQVDDVG